MQYDFLLMMLGIDSELQLPLTHMIMRVDNSYTQNHSLSLQQFCFLFSVIHLNVLLICTVVFISFVEYVKYSSQTIKILGSWTASSGILLPQETLYLQEVWDSAAKISSDAFSLWILIAVTWFMYSVFFMHVSYLFTRRYFNFCDYFNKNYS